MRSKLTSYETWKDITDRLIGVVALAVLSPMLIIISLAIIVDSPGGPIFSQVRIGKRRRKFTLYKFRTMRKNNDDREYKVYVERLIKEGKPYARDGEGPLFKLANDKRITRLGRLLRKADLDELPQLINMAKGELSLVGPRPDIPEAVDLYQDWHLQRLAVKPGLTGPWQINGRDRVAFDEMVRMDLDYIRRCSPALDIRAVLLTVPSIVKRIVTERRYRDGKNRGNRLRLLGHTPRAQLPRSSASDCGEGLRSERGTSGRG